MLKGRGELDGGSQFGSAKFRVGVVELRIVQIVCVDKPNDKTQAWSGHLDPHIIPFSTDLGKLRKRPKINRIEPMR